MKFAFTLLAFAASVLAQGRLSFTNPPSAVQAGEPTILTWTGGIEDSPVTITLRRGDSADLQTVEIVTGNAVGGAYTWTPSEDLENGEDYALEISQGVDDSNYTGQFTLTGGQLEGSVSSSSATATSETTTTANSTSTRANTVTMTGTGPSSSGTGTSMSRNTTMSMATLTSTTGINIPSPTETEDTTPEPTETAEPTEDAASHLGAQVGVGIAAVMGLAALL